MPSVPAYPELVATMARKGVTQQELADSIPCSVGHVGDICRGTARPSEALRQRIADRLGVDDVEALFELHPALRRLIESAVEQGFARHVEDPNVLRKLATLARPTPAGS